MVNLGGKPLVQWTVEAARDSGVFDIIVVSSDSDEILELGVSLGCVAYKRSDALATSRARIFDVCVEAVEQFPCDSFAMLSPTSPFRGEAEIQYAYTEFSHLPIDCLMSATEYEYPPQWALTYDGHKLRPTYREVYQIKRQDLLMLCKHDGSMIMCKADKFLEVDDWIEMETVPFYLPREKAVDIDEPIDLKWAEFLLGERNEN